MPPVQPPHAAQQPVQPHYDQPPYEPPPAAQQPAPQQPHTLAYERPPVEDFEPDYQRDYGRSYDYPPERDYGRGRDYGHDYPSDRDRPFYEQPLPDFDDEPPRRQRRRRPEPDDYDDEERERKPRRRKRESAEDYEVDRERRADRARLFGSLVHFLTGLIVTIFVLHIVFNLFSANPKSGIVSFVHTVAQTLVFGFGDVFKPGDNTIGLVVNYGLAALVYFILGRLLARTLRQR